ncbi:MAG: adenylate/guanylate cyclase domain-containing protein [Hypericibacter sp.]
MVKERVERRLAAILATDVAGYSRLTGADEEGTLARLTAHRRELIDPAIAEHRGRIVKTTGDGMLVEFASVVDALRGAVEIQRGMAERNAGQPSDRRIDLRIGINLGDIIHQEDDIFGDGVNVAARLEGLADPGGIFISDDAHRHVRGKIDLTFEDLGDQSLKNIAHPVRVFRVRLGPTASKANPAAAPLTLPDKPSIAVLPFQNMSGDPGQEYFADGIVEEIITALSRMRWLFVIARNSSFTYKGRAVDVKQVGRELGVRYVLEGSLRKSGDKVRITGQLIDCATGAHLWADRFDGGLEDIFDLQDQVTASVIGAIAPKLEQAEIERSKRKPTESLDAYDYYLRALSAARQWTREGNAEALAHFARAIELDPDFASAYGMAARCYSQRKSSGWVVDLAQDVAETARLIRRVAELGSGDAVALCSAGFALGHVMGNVEDGDAMIDRALALNPNLAIAWLFSGWAKVWLGEPELAIERTTWALRLSPQDPLAYSMLGAMAYAHFLAGRYSESVSWAERAIRERPAYGHVAARVLAASWALAGRQDEARKAMRRLRELDPALRMSSLRNMIPVRRPEDYAKLVEGLKLAGLPE